MHVLCFHHITYRPLSEFDITPGALREFLEATLAANLVIAAPSAVLAEPDCLGEGCTDDRICLIFDDGYRSTLDFALPLMAEFGASFGMAPVPGLMQDTERPSAMPHSSTDFVTADDLRAWLHDGGELLGHSHSHVALTTLSTSTLTHELDTELVAYGQFGLAAPTIFAYPFGAHDQRVQAAVAARYQAAFATGNGVPMSGSSRYEIHRITYRRRKLERLLRLDWTTLEAGSDD